MKLAFTGDLAFSKYFKSLYDKPDLVDGEIVKFLNDCDCTVANVEGAISSGALNAKKSLIHSNPPECADFLLRINSKVWDISNNHIIDCGDEGIDSTLECAKNNGCMPLGAGANVFEASRYAEFEDENGVSVGVFSVTMERFTPKATESNYGCIVDDDYKKIREIIKDVKSKNKWCVVVAHSGEEFNAVPLPYVRKQFRKYLKMGADLVVGHHPHVVENYEKVGDKMVFYSLGNFIFDTDYQRLQDYSDVGVLLNVDFGKNAYTWECMGTKIDRENHKVTKGDVPVIFTDVNSCLYKKLWPLSARILFLNERVKRAYTDPGKREFTNKQWLKFEWNRCKKNTGAKDIMRGRFLYHFGAWKRAPKHLIQYVKGNREK